MGHKVAMITNDHGEFLVILDFHALACAPGAWSSVSKSDAISVVRTGSSSPMAFLRPHQSSLAILKLATKTLRKPIDKLRVQA